MAKRYWLMKSEPDVYSIDHLARDGVTPWEGVRNYQARNLLRDEIHVGDGVLFYHSSTQPPGVAGLAEAVHESYPDRTAFDPASPYFDPKSTRDAPRWFVVDVRFVERFPAVVPLSVLHETPGLEDMRVIKKGMRLSVQPVTPEEWDIVVALGRAASPAAPATTADATPATTAGAMPAVSMDEHADAPASRGKGKTSASRGKGKTSTSRGKGTPASSGARAEVRRATPGAAGTKVATRGKTPGRGRPPASRR
ncbi:MAG TPA: EVE domain-containing protein [Haliangium sp.]|nr:EVE domain-containing protein [Haliangium sp.]